MMELLPAVTFQEIYFYQQLTVFERVQLCVDNNGQIFEHLLRS